MLATTGPGRTASAVPFGTGPTFTQVPSPPAAPFAFLFPAGVPQRPPGTSLGNLADRLMFRLAYRNFGTPTAPDESLRRELYRELGRGRRHPAGSS